jgi:hypothetical protein
MSYQFARHAGLRQVAPPGPSCWASVSEDQRHEMIAKCAYFIARSRGFQGGDPLADWLQAEAEVDEHLANGLG